MFNFQPKEWPPCGFSKLPFMPVIKFGGHVRFYRSDKFGIVGDTITTA